MLTYYDVNSPWLLTPALLHTSGTVDMSKGQRSALQSGAQGLQMCRGGVVDQGREVLTSSRLGAVTREPH